MAKPNLSGQDTVEPGCRARVRISVRRDSSDSSEAQSYWRFDSRRFVICAASSCFYADRQREMERLLAGIDAQGIEPLINGDSDEKDRSYIGEIRGQDCLESLGSLKVGTWFNSDDATIAKPDHEGRSVGPGPGEGVSERDSDEAGETLGEDGGLDEATPPSAGSAASHQSHVVLPNSDSRGKSEEEANGTSEQTGGQSEEQRTVAETVAHGPETWLALSHWARIKDVLEPRERSLAYNVGDRIRRGIEPSFAQAKWAKTILQRAREMGFTGAEPSGNGS